MLTICYFTNRREPRFEWFYDGLKEYGFHGRLVVIDFYALERTPEQRARANVWVEPKPTVWQGRHKLTSVDYFAASNARNTALCYCPKGHVAFVDDLSVLMPGWMDVVKDAANRQRQEVVLGRYTKVNKLVVEGGIAKSWEKHGPGEDSRYRPDLGTAERPMGGGGMYGCSLVGPVEAFLKINGFDEDCDSMGAEDYTAGIMMEQQGVHFVYNQKMWTLESEEDHHVEPPFKRIIKAKGPNSKFGELDASHAHLNMVRGGRRIAPNYCNLRVLRDHILNGGEFPVSQTPEHDWRDGQPLREM